MKSFSRMVLLLAVVVMAMGAGCGGGGGSSTTTGSGVSFSQTNSNAHPVTHTPMPISVEALPKSAQLTDEMLREIRINYKVTQDIAVNPANSERIDCEDCALVLYGVVLYPPFYITIIEESMYVNGYQIIPWKPVKQIFFKRTPEEEEAFRKYWEREQREEPLADFAQRTVERAILDNRNEIWIREQFASKNLPVERVVFQPNQIAVVDYQLPETGHRQVFYILGGEGIGPRPRFKQTNPRKSLEYRDLRDGLRDRTLYIMTNGFRANPRIETLGTIVAILKSDVDDRVKLYQLEQEVGIDIVARGLLANN